MTLTESFPARARDMACSIAATGALMSTSFSPSASVAASASGWSDARYPRTFSASAASCARAGSSQNTAGDSERRARVTASRTQSRTAASLVWHMRQRSPALTSCSKTGTRSRAPSSETKKVFTTPSSEARKVLSWLPYSSALRAISPTLETLPMVATSKAPFLFQS